MRKFLSDPVWQGIGVIVAIIIAVVTCNYVDDNKTIKQEIPAKETPITSLDTISSANIDASIEEEKKEETKKHDTESKHKLFLQITDNILSNLDKTKYNEQDYDYWPSGGIRSIYHHVKSLAKYDDFVSILPTSLYVSGPHTNKTLVLNEQNDFGHYNPQSVKWIKESITIYLNDANTVRRTKPFVDKYLKNQIITYWLCYQYMQAYSLEKKYLLDDYKGKIDAGKLPERYYYNIAWKGEENFEFYKELSTYKFVDGNILCSAVYFWLRRNIDSTDGEFFNIINTVVKRYYPSEAFHYQNYIPNYK